MSLGEAVTESHPRCVASTEGSFNQLLENNHGGFPRHFPNLFKEVQFTCDGTTLVALNEDQRLRTYILPPDLLEQVPQPHVLRTYSEWQSATNVQSFALYPLFDTQDTATSVILHSSAHVPITLRNALHYDTAHGSFPWVKPSTEEFLSARSLIFARDGTHFIAGGDNILALFDVHADGSGPVVSHKLKQSRRFGQHAPSAVSSHGIVTALDISGDGTLAMGTQTREVALFDGEGSGSCVTVFSLGTPQGAASVRGSGVMHLKWSPCGRYLLIAERQSDCIVVYDIRNTLRRVSVLTGRQANTTQRMGIDVVPNVSGYEVWAGGTDGHIRMWSNPGSVEGKCSPDTGFKLHDAPISSAVWHPQGSVLATCSGERVWPNFEDEEDGRTNLDNSLKVWTV